MAGPSFNLTTAAAGVFPREEALQFFGEQLGCEISDDSPTVLRSDELQITVWIDLRDEEPTLADYLRTDTILVVAFDPARGLDSVRYANLISRIVAASAKFLHNKAWNRGILYEDTGFEIMMMQHEDGRIEFDDYLSAADGLNYSGAFNTLVTKYPVAHLGTLEL
jgi:hypothetical protein